MRAAFQARLALRHPGAGVPARRRPAYRPWRASQACRPRTCAIALRRPGAPRPSGLHRRCRHPAENSN
ncbi:MAG: hypothetical protein MZW92_07970 [Comamonadaceae bacterium]|nr:hypothetical protein [Comamonadaceae bacterium]